MVNIPPPLDLLFLPPSLPPFPALQCHVNVEYCASVKSVKYLFKYVFKGHDCANVVVTVVPPADVGEQGEEGAGAQQQGGQQQEQPRVVDEILDFQNGRYVGASEASWRIFGFKLHDRGANVERLPIHLPNQQPVEFDEDNNLMGILDDGPPVTKLTDWFELNQRDATAREISYMDIPSHFTWQIRGGDGVRGPHWKRRVHRMTFPTIGRIYNVSRSQVSRGKGRSWEIGPWGGGREGGRKVCTP